MTARLNLLCHGSTDAVRARPSPGTNRSTTAAKSVQRGLSDACRTSIAVGPAPNCGPVKPPKALGLGAKHPTDASRM